MGGKVTAEALSVPERDAAPKAPEIAELILEAPIDAFAGDEDDESRRFGWVAPLLAVLLALGWIGGMGWAALPELRAAPSAFRIAEFVGLLCVPPALIGIVYLLALRTSRAEAARFGASARAMRAEAASLERMVVTLAHKIADNRAALAEQTNLLIAMGDQASERLSGLTQVMSDRTQAIDASARSLSEAASGAERSVQTVLSSLPRAHEEMRAMAATVDSAGVTASERAAALDAQLFALAERGREADHIASGAAQRLAANIARMEATSETAGVRLETVTSEMASAIDIVLDRAAQAVEEARKSITAQGDAILAMLSTSQTTLDRTARDGAEALVERIAAIDAAIARISLGLAEEQVRSELLVSNMSTGIARVDGELDALHRNGMERIQAVAASVSALGGSFDAMTEAMKAGDATAKDVVATAESLLLALDSTTREMDETLPDALDRLDARIKQSRTVVSGAKPELLALVTAAESTHDAIEAIADVVRQQRDTLAETSEALLGTLEKGHDKADALEAIVDTTIATARRFAEEAAPHLVEALMRVRETAVIAADEARTTLSSIAPHAAGAIEEAATGALRRAVSSSVRRQLTELAETTEAAVNAGTRASERLTQQMLALTEATATIEDRIDRVRAEQEQNDADHFARRVSLLIEALNSAAIDLTKAFSTEVSDSAWAAYLKGDRGVFTRRAVRLLDNGEAREIVRLYEEDDGFREQVNRYIHDFEAMLRQLLALRDGAPMGVTLLSADMGKLYVVLAQAIERIRS